MIATSRLATRFDVDLGERERQLSWGMRIASFLGAVALAASAFFFLYRIWGLLATPLQLARWSPFFDTPRSSRQIFDVKPYRPSV